MEQVADLGLVAKKLSIASTWRSTVELRGSAEDPELEGAAPAAVSHWGGSSCVSLPVMAVARA